MEIQSGVTYKLIEGSRAATKQLDGTRVILAPGYDYGLAADDSRLTGIAHVSVCLEGTTGPFFTTPESNLARADATPEELAARLPPEGVRAVLSPWKQTPRPFHGFVCVYGVVEKSKDFVLGGTIFTNEIDKMEYDEEKGNGYVLTKSGSKYILGQRFPPEA